MYFIGVDNGAARTQAVVFNLESACAGISPEEPLRSVGWPAGAGDSGSGRTGWRNRCRKAVSDR